MKQHATGRNVVADPHEANTVAVPMAPPPKKTKHHTFQEVTKLNLSTHGQYKHGAREKPKSIRLTMSQLMNTTTTHRTEDKQVTNCKTR
jgi:hypothetical protein